MAFLAGNFRVTAFQGEARFLMIKTDGIPIFKSVAFFTLHFPAFSELSLVNVCVTLQALGSPLGEFEIGLSFRHFHRMAIPALCFQVSSFQLKRGMAVIK